MTTEVDAALIVLGFIESADGTLRAPDDAVVTLAPPGSFYELGISLDAGVGSVVAVLAKSAIKVVHK
jgi:hypothetical protein